ncbi:MAG: hypothetical protein M3Q65_06030 [Chloroflexota bacterium]|nr:hypothetical protein [Chloroflexota bacterium]
MDTKRDTPRDKLYRLAEREIPADADLWPTIRPRAVLDGGAHRRGGLRSALRTGANWVAAVALLVVFIGALALVSGGTTGRDREGALGVPASPTPKALTKPTPGGSARQAPGERSAGTDAPATGAPATGRTGAGSYITTTSLEDLVARSSIIVVARVSGTGETINLARDPADPARPDPQYFSGGQVYHVAVQRYLKGEGADSLRVVQPEAFLVNPPATITPAELDRAKAEYQHIPMRAETPYLLFLRPLGGFPADAQYLTGTVHPWRFTVPQGGDARVESPWEGADRAFPIRPSAVLIGQVERLVQTR